MEAEVHTSVTQYGDAHGVFTALSRQAGKLFALGQVRGHPNVSGRDARHEREEEYEKDDEERGYVDLANLLQSTLADSLVVASAGRPDFRCMVTTDGVDTSRESGEL